MKKIINYLLILILLIPCVVFAGGTKLEGEITASVTLDQLDDFVTVVDAIEELTDSVVIEAVKNNFMCNFTEGVTGHTESVTNIVDAEIDYEHGYISGTLAYSNDNTQSFKLDIVPIVEIPLPVNKMGLGRYQLDFLAVLIKHYYGSAITNQISNPAFGPNYLNYSFNREYDSENYVCLQIGDNHVILVTSSSDASGFTESVATESVNVTLTGDDLVGILAKIYESGELDSTINYINNPEYFTSYLLEVDTISDEISSLLSGKGAVNYYTFYNANENGNIELVCYDKFNSTDKKIVIYNVKIKQDNNKFEVFNGDKININDYDKLNSYYKNYAEEKSGLQIRYELTKQTKMINEIKSYIATAYAYIYKNGEKLNNVPVYIKHIIQDNYWNELEKNSFAYIMEKDSTQSITIANKFNYTTTIEVPTESQQYFEVDNSASVVKAIKATSNESKNEKNLKVKTYIKLTGYETTSDLEINGEFIIPVTVYETLPEGGLAKYYYDDTRSVIEFGSLFSKMTLGIDESSSVAFSSEEYLESLNSIYDASYEYASKDEGHTKVSNFEQAFDSEINQVFFIKTLKYTTKDEGMKDFSVIISYEFYESDFNIDETLSAVFSATSSVITSINDIQSIGNKVTFEEYVNNIIESNSTMSSYLGDNGYNFEVIDYENKYSNTSYLGTYAKFKLRVYGKSSKWIDNYVSQEFELKYNLSYDITIYDGDRSKDIINDIKNDISIDGFGHDYVAEYYNTDQYKIRLNGSYITIFVNKKNDFAIKQKDEYFEVPKGETVSLMDAVKFANYVTTSVVATAADNTYSVIAADGKIYGKDLVDAVQEVSVTFKPTGKADVPMTIKYKVVEPGIELDVQTVGTTLDQLKTSLGGKNISLFEKDGTTPASGTLKTGQIVKYAGRSYDVIVKGDADGDGVVDIMDYIAIRKHIMGTDILVESSPYYIGADYTQTDGVDIMDYIGIKKLIMGIE